MTNLDILQTVNTPSYVIDERKLRENLEVLKMVQDKTGCHILLAQKAFSMFYFYPMIGKYLSGATASGLFEAKLAHEFMPGKENHVFSPAYKEQDFAELVQICDHIIFNSFAQWKKYKDNPLMTTELSKGISSPGHNSIVTSKDGKMYIVYHRHADPNCKKPNWDRVVCIDEIYFDKNGKLRIKE